MSTIDRLKTQMAAHDLDGLVAFSPENVTYLTGYLVPSHPTNRARRTITVLTSDGVAVLIVVSVEEDQARRMSAVKDVRSYNQFSEHPIDILGAVLGELRVDRGRLGIELDYMPASDYVLLSKYLPADKMVPNRELYLAARMVKSESEIAVLRRIATISDSAQAAAWNAIAPGMSEKELSAFVTNEVLSSGGDSLRLLIGGGERSGLVNPRPSDRRIVSGDVLRLEVLANLDNYQSNVTRTGIIGRAEASHEKIWSTLIEARRAALDLLAPGRPVRDLWTAYERGCRHGDVMPTLQFLGHGIGLSGHEEPYITADSELVLEPGVVLTFEPFVMFPDLMGFHIEDMFLVTPSGYEILTTATDNGRLIEVASA